MKPKPDSKLIDLLITALFQAAVKEQDVHFIWTKRKGVSVENYEDWSGGKFAVISVNRKEFVGLWIKQA